MKENSIEEDIVKKFEKLCENWYVFKDDDMGGHFEGVVGDQRANTLLGYLIFKEELEDFLSDYKRVLKENEKLKNKIMEKDLEIIGKEEYTKASMKEIIEQYYTANEDCITKQRIEDIIDRIDYDIKKTKEIISNGRRNDYQITRLKAMNTKSLDIKKRLQELLESEE